MCSIARHYSSHPIFSSFIFLFQFHLLHYLLLFFLFPFPTPSSNLSPLLLPSSYLPVPLCLPTPLLYSRLLLFLLHSLQRPHPGLEREIGKKVYARNVSQYEAKGLARSVLFQTRPQASFPLSASQPVQTRAEIHVLHHFYLIPFILEL